MLVQDDSKISKFIIDQIPIEMKYKIVNHDFLWHRPGFHKSQGLCQTFLYNVTFPCSQYPLAFS
jgi:hypothetical protein